MKPESVPEKTGGVTAVILTYNQPDDGDELLRQIENQGFDEILYIDNGSDPELVSNFANFRIPRNVRLPGQMRLAAQFLIDHGRSEWIWFLSTSCKLLTQNYLDALVKAASQPFLKDMVTWTPSIEGPQATRYADLRSSESFQGYRLCNPIRFQMISIAIKRSFLRECEAAQIGIFNRGLFTGCALDYETLYFAACQSKLAIADHSISVGWDPNLGIRKGVDRTYSDVDDYHRVAVEEFNTVFARKYGLEWKSKFEDAYRQLAKTIPASIEVDPAILR